MSLYARLKSFQKGIVDKNVELILKIVSGESGVIGRQVTEAPTGSGKTLMMASVIEAALRLQYEPNFIWITHNKQILVQTHNEIRDSIGSYLTSWLAMEQGIQSFGGRVLLLNVQKGVSKRAKEWLTKWVKYQDEMDPRRPVVFVIDESDEGMSGKNMDALRDVLKPCLELGFTASFKKKDNEYLFIKVPYQEVIDAGMLVEQLEYQASDEVTRKELTLRAIKQRELLEQYANQLKLSDPDRFFVPKMLIQAPAADCEAVARELQAMLKMPNVEFEKKVIVHTQNSRGLDEIEDLSDVRFIIGDLMVERGWNCPEAYVLLSTKDSVSRAKGIQLLGRVIRLPMAQRFDDAFDYFNKGYIYIAGKHSIEESCRNFGSNELPCLPPPREVVQIERREDIFIPNIITFKDELDKDIEDRDLIPVSESLCEELDFLRQRCVDSKPEIRRGVLDLDQLALTRNPSEIVESEWNVEQTKRTLIHALTSHIPRNYANLVITKYQIKMRSQGGLGHIAQFAKEMAKLVRESQRVRRIASTLEYVHEVYQWPPHKLVSAQPAPYKYSRAVYPKMQLNQEESRFATFLNQNCEENNWFWIRNDPSNVKLFRSHAPDFIVFNKSKYAFIEYKGKYLLKTEDSIRKNRVGQAASAYFMVYEETDTGRFLQKGFDDERSDEFDKRMLLMALR
jgi:hypothetical protein